MESKNYNIIKKSINNGLTAEPIGTAGGYVALLSAPTNANVRIHLNDRNADAIPLKNYHAIEATEVKKIFVSADAVTGEAIEIVQAHNSKDFRMITPASDVNIDEISGYSASLITALDKISNPYQNAITTIVETVSTTDITLLNKTLASDKIKVLISTNACNYRIAENIEVALDSVKIASITNLNYNYDSYKFHNFEFEVENVKGRILSITGKSASGIGVSATLQEFTLKT